MSWVPDKDEDANVANEKSTATSKKRSSSSSPAAKENPSKSNKNANNNNNVDVSKNPEKRLLNVLSGASSTGSATNNNSKELSDVPQYLLLLNKKIVYVRKFAQENPEKIAAIAGGVVIGAAIAGKAATVIGLVGAKSKLKFALAAGGAALGGEVVSAMLNSNL
jgi:hypothetical protein